MLNLKIFLIFGWKQRLLNTVFYFSQLNSKFLLTASQSYILVKSSFVFQSPELFYDRQQDINHYRMKTIVIWQLYDVSWTEIERNSDLNIDPCKIAQ